MLQVERFSQQSRICFDIVAVFGSSVERNFISSTPFDSQNVLNMFNLFRLCRKDEISRKIRLTLLLKTAAKSNVASTKSNVALTLLLVWNSATFKGYLLSPL